MTGRVVLDDRGDREPDYWAMDMHPNGTFVRVAERVNREDGSMVRCSATVGLL